MLMRRGTGEAMANDGSISDGKGFLRNIIVPNMASSSNINGELELLGNPFL